MIMGLNIMDKARGGSWLILAAAMAIVMWYSGGKANLDVLTWKALLLTSAAYLGYWLDRTLFPGARPHEMERLANTPQANGEPWDPVPAGRRADAARLRRAIIVASVVLAAALGI